jgi:formylglycine-generating enzyme required for sulfatase activity
MRIILAAALFFQTEDQAALLKTFRSEFVEIKERPYRFAKYEVPQNLWESVMGSNPSKWMGKRNSVEMLSFAEAEEFCRKATELMRAAKLIDADQVVRLPSEAEWEHAARAGTKTAYSFGDDAKDLGEYGWFTGNAQGNDPPVGAKKPNPWGLYDVHGYLWEWCSDAFDGDPKKRPLRGGSWKDKAEKLTSSFRMGVSVDLKDDAVGLRCVLASTEKK